MLAPHSHLGPYQIVKLGFLEVILLNFAAAEQHFLLSHQAKPDQALTVW